MRASVTYTLARLGIFAACLGIGALAGLRDPLILLLAAATVSMLLSLFLLARLRDQFSADVAERVEQRRARRQLAGEPARAAADPGAQGTQAGADGSDAESFR